LFLPFLPKKLFSRFTFYLPLSLCSFSGLRWLWDNSRSKIQFLMSVLGYIEETNPPEVRELLIAAHHFLQETLPPFATSSIKWRIPFYTLRRNFCYLNRHPNYITLGFPHGYKLAPRPGVLLGEDEKLKQVRYLEIHTVEDLYSEETHEILHEAIMLDEIMAKASLKFGRKNRRARH
jgi:hypothetical protein